MGLFLKFALLGGLVSSSRALDVSMIQAAATSQRWVNYAPVPKPVYAELKAEFEARQDWAKSLAAVAAKPKPASAHAKTEYHMEAPTLGLDGEGGISTDGLIDADGVQSILDRKSKSIGITGLMAKSNLTAEEAYALMTQEEKDDARKDANLKAAQAYAAYTPNLSGEYTMKAASAQKATSIETPETTKNHFTGAWDGSGAEDYDFAAKKGAISAADSTLKSTQAESEDRNRTNETRDDFQLDARTNMTSSHENPAMYTNRTGYAKNAWEASDKFQAWQVAEVVDFLLASATNVDDNTGSVGRVGKDAAERQYSVSMQDYRSARKPNVSFGY